MSPINLGNARIFAATAVGLLFYPASVNAHMDSPMHSLLHGAAPVGFVILMVAVLYFQINKLRN